MPVTEVNIDSDLHASLARSESPPMFSHPEGDNSRIIPITFGHLPVEIVDLIANQAERRELRALCRVNRVCNAVCTTMLYGDRIITRHSQALSYLYNTLLRLRPDLALGVRELCIDDGVGPAGWWLFGPAG